MLRWFARRLSDAQKEEKGFTLIELMVVIIIIAILAAIAIPAFLAQRERAWEAAAQSDLRNAAGAAQSCATQFNGNYTNCGTYTAVDGPNNDLRDFGYRPSENVVIQNLEGTPTATRWAARAQHSSGGSAYQFDTAAQSRVVPIDRF